MSKNDLPTGSETQAKKFEALGRFAGGIAHDFNNILSVIEAGAQQAVKELAAGKLTPERLEKIRAATKRGAGITRQLLSFSRQKIQFDETRDLIEAVQQCRDFLQDAAGPGVAVSFDLSAQPLWCQIDGDEVFQILLNLVTNARDAQGGQDGIITISCHAMEGQIILSVTDNGPGIPGDILPHIFDPFFTTKPQGKGTGLGLSVVHGIVHDRQGRIEVSSSPGTGAGFHIFFRKR